MIRMWAGFWMKFEFCMEFILWMKYVLGVRYVIRMWVDFCIKFGF